MNSIPLIQLLLELKSLIARASADVTWSQYDNKEQVLQNIYSFIERVKQNDSSVIEEINIFFAPPGSFQEIAISSGWGDEYMKLAARFDEIIS